MLFQLFLATLLVANNALANRSLQILCRSPTARRLMNLITSRNLVNLSILGSVLVRELLRLILNGHTIRVITNLSLFTLSQPSDKEENADKRNP